LYQKTNMLDLVKLKLHVKKHLKNVAEDKIMEFKNFFIIKSGESYSAPCPFCRKDLMRFIGDNGPFKEFKCKGCGQHLLYGGQLGEHRRVDELASRFSSNIPVPERRIIV